MRSVRHARAAVALVFLLSVVLPASAGADVQTLTFDTAPPALGAPVDGFGDMTFSRSLGFRPYRTEVGAQRARSGTVVGDLGRCLEETGGGIGCEFFSAHAMVQLSRTAEVVTLFAGRFGPADPTDSPEGVILTAFRSTAHGLEKLDAAGPILIDNSGFTKRVSVANAAGEISSFTIEAVKRDDEGHLIPAGDLGIDDLMVNYASGGVPDFSVSTTGDVVPVVQGQHVDVPIQLPRLNGSFGPILVSVSGLPNGVSATVLNAAGLAENPVLGAKTTATLRLSADPFAPDTHFVPTDATITADPQRNSDVGPGPRTTTLSVRVATSFGLSAYGFSDTNLPPNGSVPIEVPDCAAVDVPLKVSRDIAFNQDISLSLREDKFGAVGLPPGVSAEILPSAVVHPGGNLVAERTLRFRVDPRANLSLPLPILLEARSGTSPTTLSRVLPMTMVRAEPHATLVPGSSRHRFTPRFGRPGSRVQIHGTSFCPGTTVEVGNDLATARAELVDEHTIEFNMPRLAVSGSIGIHPPAPFGAYRTTNRLTVDSVRNSDGFQFRNYTYGGLSFNELIKAFGVDDIFIKVNPCWPWGDCTVVTGIPNKLALIDWGVFNWAENGSNSGHCFGMNLASRLLVGGKESYGQFATVASPSPAHVFDISGPKGPNAELSSFLDAMQVRQLGDEYLAEWLDRDKSIQAQLDAIEREFTHNREPLVSLKYQGHGHSVLAYDMVQTADSAEIYVVESSFPFIPEEELYATLHRDHVNAGIIRIDKVSQTWAYPLRNWGGGNDGGLWIPPPGALPDDPSLPGFGALKGYLASISFGSTDGSVGTAGGSRGAEYLPAADAVGVSGAPIAPAGGGTWVTDRAGQPLSVAFEGVKPGHYTQAYSAPGFVAGATDVVTDEGVRDTVKGAGDSLTFAGGKARPLQIELAQRPSSTMTIAATVDTHASAGGSDTAGFSDDGALTYAHDGAPTTAGFTLSTVRRDGGPATFLSGPVAVGRGDRLSLKPLDRDLHRVRLAIRDGHGKTRTRVLRNRSRPHMHLKLGAPKLSGHRLSLRLKLVGHNKHAIVGVALRMMRGKHLVAHKAVSLRIAKGTAKITWRLPRAAGKGHYRLLTDVRAIAIGTPGAAAAASVSAHRARRVYLKPR